MSLKDNLWKGLGHTKVYFPEITPRLKGCMKFAFLWLYIVAEHQVTSKFIYVWQVINVKCPGKDDGHLLAYGIVLEYY